MWASVVCCLCLTCVWGASWSYDGMTGPSYWASLDPSWAECGGQRQSPIDIITDDVTEKGMEFMKLYHHMTPVQPVVLKNDGHTLHLDLASRDLYLASSALPRLMQVLQFHFHAPSEHAINGKLYPLEVHFVSQTIDRAHFGGRAPTAVVGVIWEAGPTPDPLLEQLRPHLAHIMHAGNETNVTFTPIIDLSDELYLYDGSFTTPPCSEIVQWMVATKIRSATQEQLDLFVPLLTPSNRPVQPLNGRNVVKKSFVGNNLGFECPKHEKSHHDDDQERRHRDEMSGRDGGCQEGGTRTYINFNGMMGGGGGDGR